MFYYILEKLLLIKFEKDKEQQKKLFNNLISELQNNESNVNEITGLLNTIISNALSMSRTLCGIEEREMLDKVWMLYQEKNRFYGDIWYSRRETGLCLDMGRKIVRIEGFMNRSHEHTSRETIYDTMLDLVNYCILMKVYLQYIK